MFSRITSAVTQGLQTLLPFRKGNAKFPRRSEKLLPVFCGGLIIACLLVAGCSNSESASEKETSATTDSEKGGESVSPPGAGKGHFHSVELGGSRSRKAGHSAKNLSPDEKMGSVLKAMQPLQVMLGEWEGKTFRKIGGFSAVETVEWVWDFQSEPAQPALVMSTDNSPYFEEAQLTYLLDEQKYRLKAVDSDGNKRELSGMFAEEPQDVPGDNNQLQRTYKLKLTEKAEKAQKETWQVVLNQQENNRYLLELYRKRGGDSYHRFDTVANQRQGTSFAISDTDYGEKTCIISQGMGTIQVSHEGKTYWVCCSGCKAAFEEDPERWIAKYEARQKKEE